MTVMKDTDYYKSGKHKENVIKARSLALIASQQKKLLRVDTYNNAPTTCMQCSVALSYTNKRNKFCSSSCAAKANNKARTDSGWCISETSRAQIGQTLSHTIASMTVQEKKLKYSNRSGGRTKHEDVAITCSVCAKVTTVPYIRRDRKTCGADDCKVFASVGCRTYQNGSRKPVWFFNPNENKKVLLDSSWEVTVAELLVALRINWIRPKFVKWEDSNKVTRRYFPDFYLVEYGVYLDPKNPYCMVKDVEKLAQVSKSITLIYGDLQKILDYVRALPIR